MRMHPEISSFPSRTFYNGQLVDAPDMAKSSRTPHHQVFDQLPPYMFLDIKDSREQKDLRSHSRVNTNEVNVIIALLQWIDTTSAAAAVRPRVAVVTPYSAQLASINREIRKRCSTTQIQHTSVVTIDGFQGGEEEIVILSTVRAGSNIGFLAEPRRINVALTRAKGCLIVLGHVATLKGSRSTWSTLVEDANNRGCLVPQVRHSSHQ